MISSRPCRSSSLRTLALSSSVTVRVWMVKLNHVNVWRDQGPTVMKEVGLLWKTYEKWRFLRSWCVLNIFICTVHPGTVLIWTYPSKTVVVFQMFLRLGLPAMGFSVRITETETGNNLFPQWCPLRKREQKQKQLMGLVAPRGRRRSQFCGVSRKLFFQIS